MNRNIKKIIALTMGLTFMTHISPVQANSIKRDSESTRIMARKSIKDKMDSDVLYVIEKGSYKEILKQNTLLIRGKDNLLVVDSENILDEEMDVIKSSERFYIVGNLEENTSKLKELDNYKSNLFGKNRTETLIKIANENKKKDLLVVHKDSLADQLTASQLGYIEDRNILIVKDELDKKTKEFLNNEGKGKNILFVEGEKSIPKETKKSIMKAAKNEKYELGEIKIKKQDKDTNKDEDKEVSILSELKLNTKTPEEKEEQEEILKAFEKATSHVSKKSKENDELVYNKGKVISYDEEITTKIEEGDKEKFASFVDNQKSLKVQKDDKIKEDKDDEYSLDLTYVKPIKISKSAKKGRKEYIVPKKITDDLVKDVMEGKYGTGSSRGKKLRSKGYDDEKVKKEIKKIEEERLERAQQAAISQAASEYNFPSESVGGASVTTSTGNNSNVDKFIDEALKMEGWAYSQPQRWRQGYADCSSLVVRSMINAGITDDKSNLTTYSIGTDSRFYEVSMGSIERGDILWNEGHMEIYMGGNTTFGAFRPGKPAGYASNIGRFNKAFRIK